MKQTQHPQNLTDVQLAPWFAEERGFWLFIQPTQQKGTLQLQSADGYMMKSNGTLQLVDEIPTEQFIMYQISMQIS